MDEDSFDYVVVGAGTSGCVVASRLAEDPRNSVALIDAGGEGRHRLIDLPLGMAMLLGKPKFDWNFQTEPEPALEGRRLSLPRGKGIGGSSLINGQVWVHGEPADYGEWEKVAGKEWGYNSVSRYFRKSEACEFTADQSRGTLGPIAVRRPLYPNHLYERFLAAGVEAGFPLVEDYNHEPDGFARSQQTQSGRRATRVSVASAYLDVPGPRANLRRITGWQAVRLGFDASRRATTIDLIQGNARKRIRASREIILSCGAYQSPQLLMLSGIGPQQHLAEHGIPCLQDAPDVGGNLQDHYGPAVEFSLSKPWSLGPAFRFPGSLLSLARGLVTGGGPMSCFHMDALAFVRSASELKRPDLQLYMVPIPFGLLSPAHGVAVKGHAMAIFVCLLKPQSRGRVSLKSADPMVPPRIVHNYLKEEADRLRLRAGVRLIRQLSATDALQNIIKSELAPGSAALSNHELDGWIASAGQSHYHPVGTCRMGGDENAVVDAALKVRGFDGLRVVDAAIMPTITSGNTYAPCVMIGEHAADMIKSDR